MVANIPVVYGLFLSRDWYQGLNCFFATNWSTLWFPKNGKSNQIKIRKQRYLRHTVTEQHDPNEPIIFHDLIMGNYMYDIDFGNFNDEKTPFSDQSHQS